MRRSWSARGGSWQPRSCRSKVCQDGYLLGNEQPAAAQLERCLPAGPGKPRKAIAAFGDDRLRHEDLVGRQGEEATAWAGIGSNDRGNDVRGLHELRRKELRQPLDQLGRPMLGRLQSRFEGLEDQLVAADPQGLGCRAIY
jgi:hypothetical protein